MVNLKPYQEKTEKNLEETRALTKQITSLVNDNESLVSTTENLVEENKKLVKITEDLIEKSKVLETKLEATASNSLTLIEESVERMNSEFRKLETTSITNAEDSKNEIEEMKNDFKKSLTSANWQINWNARYMWATTKIPTNELQSTMTTVELGIETGEKWRVEMPLQAMLEVISEHKDSLIGNKSWNTILLDINKTLTSVENFDESFKDMTSKIKNIL